MPSPVQAGCAVVVDARCLQDPDYAGRGVGRHALALIGHLPPGDRIDLVALTDPALPPMAPSTAALFAVVTTNPYAAHIAAARIAAERHRGSAAFVALSPMTHDPLYTARFLGNRACPATAVVYDFIQLRHPERYLVGAAASLAYALSMEWLCRFARFAPISQSSADDLVRHLSPPTAAIRVTGAPLTASHAAPRDPGAASPTGLLVIGGADSRKDPETVIRAHARSAVLQRSRTVLTVAGSYDLGYYQPFFAGIAAEAGGDPTLLHLPGYMPEHDLVALYRSAAVVVCPSIDEGFSLPVIEGMAAGAVVLASDIPAHRELIGNAARLFPPGDATRLAAILDAVHGDDAAARAAVAAQDRVWTRFRAADVARRFWEHALPSQPAPPILRRTPPRIAVLSPLPPARSGVADYTAATCAELAKLATVDIYTETPHPTAIPGVARMFPMSDLPVTTGVYDRTVAVTGNSHFHIAVMERLQRYGGACIAHDARMLSYYMLTRGAAGVTPLASSELGRPVSLEEVLHWARNERFLPTNLLSEIAAASTPMIVHSPVTQAMLRDRLGIGSVHLPFSVYRTFPEADLTPARRHAARARLGIPENEIVLATFGFVDQMKAPADCVWALEILRGWGLNASLHFPGLYVADNPNTPSIHDLARQLGVADHVRTFDGYIDEDLFRDYLLAADVGIQLRLYGLGGLSGALLDCAAAGLPMVANASLAEAVELPPAYSRAIPDALSPLLLAEAVAELHAAGRNPAQVEARRRFTNERSFARYAAGLLAALDLD